MEMPGGFLGDGSLIDLSFTPQRKASGGLGRHIDDHQGPVESFQLSEHGPKAGAPPAHFPHNAT